MQKIKTKIVTAILLSTLALTLVPLAFASLGNILINDNTVPQDLPIPGVPAGGNITLNFGNVTFSGSQFYLLMSQDGLSQVSAGDMRYTPLFNVAAVLDPVITQVSGDVNFPGAWTIGQGWVNGSILTYIAGGTYYIKAFDGATTALAVTQGFPVIASLNLIPVAGAAGTTIIVSGNAFPANSLVNLSYVDPSLNIVRFANLTQTNALGQINYTMPAPDVKTAPGAGDATPTSVVYTFHATENATAADYTAIYTETERGLMQLGRPRVGPVAGNLQNATGLYGNLTSFNLVPTIPGTTITVGVGDTFRVVGNYFYPGVVTMLWDNSIDITPNGNVANQTGYFNATFTVPGTGLGSHNITMIDSGLQVFVVFVNVQQSITIAPTSGPIGTTVTVIGYGFPANNVPTGNVYNVTVTFGTSATVRAWSLTDASGQFTTSFTVPVSPGGANSITATANDTALTSASKTFTVTALFTVTPETFYANSTNTVVAKGTGFDPSVAYFVAIDNQFSPFTNTTNGLVPSSAGNLSLTFVQAGFQPGVHVVSIYPVGAGTGGSYAPTAMALFTVLGTVSTGNVTTEQLNSTLATVLQKLDNINATVVAVNGNLATVATNVGYVMMNLTAIGANVTSIKGSVATIQTSLGTVQTSVNNINANITGISSGFASLSGKIDTLTTTVNSISSSVSGIATISTTVGSIQSSLSSIGATVTSIKDGVATIQTDLGTLTGTVSTINNGVATIQTDVGTLQTNISDLQTSVNDVPGQVNVPIWIAVVLALIAALAAIASLLLVRRKIAG